jgi:hypothetical protein
MGLTEKTGDTHQQKNVDTNKYRFRWLEWHLFGGVKILLDETKADARAYEASYLTKDSRKCMDDLDYGANAVDQVAMLVSIVIECRFSF